MTTSYVFVSFSESDIKEVVFNLYPDAYSQEKRDKEPHEHFGVPTRILPRKQGASLSVLRVFDAT
jgi:hypothetical protein